MIRTCDGTDPNLRRADGGPCACGRVFNDAERMVIYPHDRIPPKLAEGKPPFDLFAGVDLDLGRFLLDNLRRHEPHPFEQLPDAAFTACRICSRALEHAIHASQSEPGEPQHELAMEMGLIPDTRPPAPKPTRWQRFRGWRRDEVAAARLAVGSWIAGTDLSDREDW